MERKKKTGRELKGMEEGENGEEKAGMRGRCVRIVNTDPT